MHTIYDIFAANQSNERTGRTRPKCRLIPPGARLVRF